MSNENVHLLSIFWAEMTRENAPSSFQNSLGVKGEEIFLAHKEILSSLLLLFPRSVFLLLRLQMGKKPPRYGGRERAARKKIGE